MFQQNFFKTFLYPLNYPCIFVKSCPYICGPTSGLFLFYLSICLLILYCPQYCSFIINLEITKYESSGFILIFHVYFRYFSLIHFQILESVWVLRGKKPFPECTHFLLLLDLALATLTPVSHFTSSSVACSIYISELSQTFLFREIPLPLPTLQTVKIPLHVPWTLWK